LGEAGLSSEVSMRTIPKPLPGPARPDVGAPPLSNEAGPVRFIRGAVRNSPWVVIAVTAHAVAIAVLSVIYVKSHQEAPGLDTVTTTRFVEPVAEEDPPVQKPVELIPREAIPAPTGEQEGPINFLEIVTPGAKAGAPGEDFEGGSVNDEPGVENLAEDALRDALAGASGGTPIGVGKYGHPGSGTPSATVSLYAGRNGRGRNGRGQGGENGPGGGPRPDKREDAAVLAALRWLKLHQSSDGRWSAAGFDAHCGANRCDGAGDSTYDVGVTGLSLLAFLGAGETHNSGTCRETVKNGLRFLREVQDSEGCVGPRTSQHFLYNHACGSLALIEAYGMTGSRFFKEPAQRSVGFILKARNPYLAWRYNVPADGDNDTSVTGWMVMALKSAKLSGLEVEKAPVNDAIAWVEKMTEPEFGRTGYQQRGGPPARTNEAMQRFPAGKSESLTAVGMTTRIFGGRDLKTDEMIGKGADLLVKCLPKWDVDQGTIDFYYWYYGSLAMFQVGGDRWKKWNESMKTALLAHQRLEKERDEYGSWDPIDPWSGEGGRVYATAINCLTMEVYYRYPVLGVR
jgi:hypothetical protein